MFVSLTNTVPTIIPERWINTLQVSLERMQQQYSMEDLLVIMRKLRAPDTGCPWDIEQTFATIAPYTIEEAYEVDDAIRAGDMAALRDELGDLLLQTVFHARIAEETGEFSFGDVVSSICQKMLRRHPHVFGDASVEDADAQTAEWEQQKEQERVALAVERGEMPSALDGVAISLPALLRAVKLQKRAARVGFDWPKTVQVLDKIQEECTELVDAHGKPDNQAHVQEEFGDLMFVMANLARHLKIDPEEALRAANAKFDKRFRKVENKINAMGKTMHQSTLDEMDAQWDLVKTEE